MTTRVATADIDLRATLSSLAILAADPTIRLEPGLFQRATITPDGAGVITATWSPDGRQASVESSGPGASWLSTRAPALLGCADDTGGFEPSTQPLRDLWRRNRGLRLTRTNTLWHDAAWLVMQQRVTVLDAAQHWRRLVLDLGTPAPGHPQLRVPPSPETIARLPYHHFHRYGIERQRATHLIAVARRLGEHQDLVDRHIDDARSILTSVPGIGPWTASFLAVLTWGSADTVVVGDDSIPSRVAWLLARERRADDARLLELLEPYRPHRARVVQLTFRSGISPPRRAPRRPRVDIRHR